MFQENQEEDDNTNCNWPLFEFMQSYLHINNINQMCEVSQAHRALNFVDYLQLLSTVNSTFQDTVIVVFALLYSNRVRKVMEKENERFCHHCVFSTCVVVASKYNNDLSLPLKSLAKTSNMPIKVMINIERNIMLKLKYDLYVNIVDFNQVLTDYKSDPY
eukprot:Pgem_evm1s53